MGLRHDILAALAAKHPDIVTIDDLMDATGEHNRTRLVSNIQAALADGLVEKLRDEVTNLPAYKLTKTGLARHKNGQQQFNGKSQAENASKSAKPGPAEQSAAPTSNETALLAIIADIRAAIGDNTGKIMLGDLATAIRERTDAGQHYQAEVERLTRKCHDLGNDVAGYAMQQGILRTKLDIGPDDDVVEAVDALLGMQAEGALHAGKLAILLIDSADMTDIEELDTSDIAQAQAEAMRNIDVGNAARAMVISIHGEAYRRSAWKEAA